MLCAACLGGDVEERLGTWNYSLSGEQWEDGEAPPPPGHFDEDKIDDIELGIAGRSTGDIRSSDTEWSASQSDVPGGLAVGHGAVEQPQREEVDFQIAVAARAGSCPTRVMQWVQKSTVERLVGRQLVQETVLAYHRKVSHIARLVASG